MLKKNGHPFGFELGHGFGDNHGWLYPLLWSYGGREVDKDGKTVLIDSDETAKAVDFCRRFYKETMFEDVLGWTDVNNNKAFFGEQISCTNNASSILVVGKRDFPEIAKVTDHAPEPAGAQGPLPHACRRAVPRDHDARPDQAAAKAFLRWLYDDKQLSRWLVSGDAYYAPFLAGLRQPPDVERRAALHAVQGIAQDTRLHGWPGPPEPRHVRERGEVRRRRHVRQGLRGHSRPRTSSPPPRASSSRSTKRSKRWPSGRHRSGGLLRSPGRLLSLRGFIEREGIFSWLMLAPGVLFLLAFVAYPFFYGIFLSLQDRPVARTGVFIGLANFVTLAHDAVFWQVTRNMFVYTIVTTILKLGGRPGDGPRDGPAASAARTWRAPSCSCPSSCRRRSRRSRGCGSSTRRSVSINWVLVHGGAIQTGFSWLGNSTLAMVAIIIVNTWRGMPFYGITLLAGLQTISPELYEVAAIDGATTRQRFWYVTMPLIKPVLVIVTMFSVIFTFSDFQLIYALTHGGPANATQVYRDVRVSTSA